MKKLLFSLVIALGAISVNAQEVGDMWVGGTAGFSAGDAETSFKFVPEVGYILSDNLAIAGSIGYTRIKESNNILRSNSGDVNGLSISPFLRYTFLKGSMGSLFVDGGVNVQFVGLCDDLANLQIGFRPGLAIPVSDKVALIGKFGFFGYDHDERTSSDNFGFDFNLNNIQIGAAFSF